MSPVRVLPRLAIVSLLIFPGSSLTSVWKKPVSQPIRRVAVIGAGIAGLSVAHALENSPKCAREYTELGGRSFGDSRFGVQVSIFDSRPSLNFQAGAGIQINGGMSVLRKINPALQAKVAAASLPLLNIRSRTKPWGDGGKDPYQTLLELNLEEAIRKTGGDAEKELIVDGEVMCYTIMRGALQEVLMDQLPATFKDKTHFGKILTGIKPAADKNGIICKFDDDSERGPFDLVVGCDGIKSAVKQYVETRKISPVVKDRSAIYSGIRIKYAVQDGDPSDPAPRSAELRQYFGDGAYALGGVYGAGEGRPPTKGAFIIVRDENYFGPFRLKDKEVSSENISENPEWTQNVQVDIRDDCLEELKRTGIPDIEVGPVFKNSDRFFELGVYFHNPFSLAGWKREVRGSGGRFCVLAGDAAHAMPPFLGQGSNQAIQDAYTLAKKIFQHNANHEKASSSIDKSSSDAHDEGAPEDVTKSLEMLLKEYEQVRWMPTASITAKASFLGYLETGQTGFLSKFRDLFFFAAGKLGIARKVFLDSAIPKV